MRLREVAAFARAEAAFYRYQELRRLLLGWGGFIVFAGLVVLVLACHAPASTPVTQPIPVEIQFTTDAGTLVGEGLAPTCAGFTAQGVAIGGSLSAPEVVIKGTPECPSAKVIVSNKVGFAVPVQD